MSEMTRVIDQRGEASQVVFIPHAVFDMLQSPYDLMLYAFYVKAHDTGTHYTIAATADACHMSEGEVRKAKRQLIELGLISSRRGGSGEPIVDLLDVDAAYAAWCSR